MNNDIESYILNMDIAEKALLNVIKSLNRATSGVVTANHFKHGSNFLISYFIMI